MVQNAVSSIATRHTKLSLELIVIIAEGLRLSRLSHLVQNAAESRIAGPP